MVVKREDTVAVEIGNGATRRVLNSGGNLMLVEFSFKKGGEGKIHSHPHEQIGFVVSGSGVFTIDGEESPVKAGDSMYIPPNVPHGFRATEDNTVLVDTFYPQREDFK